MKLNPLVFALAIHPYASLFLFTILILATAAVHGHLPLYYEDSIPSLLEPIEIAVLVLLALLPWTAIASVIALLQCKERKYRPQAIRFLKWYWSGAALLYLVAPFTPFDTVSWFLD